DLHLGAHARFDPVVGAVDGDGGEVNLEAGVHPAILRIGQHTDLGDFAVQDGVRESVHGNADVQPLLDFLDVALVVFAFHGHFGHVRDGDDGLPFAHGGAFADGLLAAVVKHFLAAAAVHDQSGFL